MVNNTLEISDEEKKTVIIEEKIRLQRVISEIRSKEINLILEEESPLYKRKKLLKTAFEVLLGVYIGIISVYLVIVLSELLS